MRNLITPLKKAAGRITVCCLFVIVALFAQVDNADAAEVLKKTSDLITGPTTSNNLVKFNLGGNVKYVKHAKFANPNMQTPLDISMTKANTRVTGFAYKCPGYYTTRIYSDARGQQMIGYIQVYVSKSDVTNSNCADITPKTAAFTPPVPKPVHPVPSVDVKPKPPIAPTVSNPPASNKNVCAGDPEYSSYDKWFYKNGICCPDTAGAGFGSDGGCWRGMSEQDAVKIYCKDNPNQKYDWNKRQCIEDGFNYEGNSYGFPKEMEEYSNYERVDDYAAFDDVGDDVIDPEEPEPEEPGGGENPPPPEGESCEENPDQDNCPPPCYCEDMGDWGYMCCIFECPGWDDYLGFLANDLVGTAKAPPVPDLPAPDIPNIFNILNSVDERNPAKPTGNEDPNLGNASFDANDIKNEAPEIQFREDPTGGFNIVNPLETLPDDGSEAPRPKEDLETLPYPDGSGKNLEGDGSVPKPEDSGSNDKINYPVNPGGTATPPTTGGKAEYPETGGSIKYPGT